MQRWLSTHGWILGVLAIASFAMLFRLGDRPIENWDEGIHGVVSLEMVERGDWVTPWYAGGTYFRKPPLKLWMTAALMKARPTPSDSPSPGARGDSPSRWEGEKAIAWALRLPNAIAGILTSLLVAWWMWQWRRSKLEAFLAGTIVATMRPIFFHAFRTGEMDGLLTLFVTAALYCWWKATRAAMHPAGGEFLISNSKFLIKPQAQMTKWMALVGLFLGLAVMTKSAAGLLPLPIIAADYLLHRRTIHISLRSIVFSVLTFSVLTFPWHLAMTALHGATFWGDYFGWHIVKRATQAIHNPTAGTWWYFPTLMRKFSPYAWWFLPALLYPLTHLWSRSRARQREADLLEATSAEAPRQLPEAQRGEAQTGAERREAEFGRGIPHASEAQRPTPERPLPKGDRDHQLACDRSTTALLFLWLLITFALFTVAKTKFDWYLLPLYPAAAMLLAVFFAAARDVARNRTTAALHLAALAITVFALPSLYPDGSTLDRAVARAYAPFGHPIVLAGIAIAMVVGAIAIAHRRWGAGVAGRIAQVLVLVLVLIPGFAVTTSHLIRVTPPGPFPTIAAAVRGTGGHLVSYGMDYKQHPAGYFILRAALSGDVRILDGRRRDVTRTLAMLREREHGFLLTQNETDLPEELRQAVGDPRTFGDFTLWQRR